MSEVKQLEQQVVSGVKPLELEKGQGWSQERQARLVAGSLAFLGAALSAVWPWAAALSGFVGLGLIVAAVTDTCAMATVLGKMPWNRKVSDAGASCPR
jgi:DUF2892 family protein